MARFTQFFAQILFRVIYKIYYRLEVRGRENLVGVNKPMLIISNHNSLNDAWVVGSSLPIWKYLPIRYMAGTKFFFPLNIVYKIGIIPFIYWMFGTLSLPQEGTFEEKIAPAVRALEKGDAVVIFPEGKRVFEDTVGEFRRGASEVALRAQSLIVPVAMRSHGRKMIMIIGKPFRPSAETAEGINSEMHATVLALYQSI